MVIENQINITEKLIRMTDCYRAVWPFTIMTLIALVITVAFPGMSLWLPEVILGK